MVIVVWNMKVKIIWRNKVFKVFNVLIVLNKILFDIMLSNLVYFIIR